MLSVQSSLINIVRLIGNLEQTKISCEGFLLIVSSGTTFKRGFDINFPKMLDYTVLCIFKRNKYSFLAQFNLVPCLNCLGGKLKPSLARKSTG